MRRNRLPAAIFAVVGLAYIASQAPILAAQLPSTTTPDIYVAPQYKHTKLSDGAVEFTDQQMGLSFTLPRDWAFGNDGMRVMDRGWRGNLEGDLATTVLLHHRHTGEKIWLYYSLPRHVNSMTPDQTDRWLLEEVDDKTSQRRMHDGLKNYHVRPSNYEHREIGGHRALAWVAEFTEGKITMVEYLVLVRSNQTLVEFSIRCPAGKLDAVRQGVEPVIASIKMQ